MLATSWTFLFVPIMGILWFGNTYMWVLVASVFVTYTFHKLFLQHAPDGPPNTFSRLKSWTLFSLCYLAVLGPFITWCILLTPAHRIWSPMTLVIPYNPEHQPVAPAEILHDPAAPGPSAIDIGAIDADIFFVHGLGSNSNRSWAHRASGVMWPRHILPKDFPTIRVIALSHDSRWDANAPVQTLTDYGSGILDAVEDVRSHPEEQGRPIIFIAHSFGGIIVKKALVLANEANPGSSRHRVADATCSTLFLGVPHGGTQAANIAVIMSFFSYWRGSRAELLEFMSPNGKDIDTLNEAFLNRYSEPLYICNFFETMGFLTVQRRSTTYQMPTKCLVAMSADHPGLNKFPSARDGNYIKLRSQIKQALKHCENRPIGEECGMKLKNDIDHDPNFVGRKKDLAEIHRYLASSVETHQRVLLLYGTGGIGKSQLALEYAYRHNEFYAAIFTIDARTEQSVISCLINETQRIFDSLRSCKTQVEAAKLLGISGLVDEKGIVSSEPQAAPRLIRALKTWLAESFTGRWLMLFDNYDQIEAFGLSKYFPLSKTGRIIITSRRPECKRLARYPKELDVLDEEAALSLLLTGYSEKESLDATELNVAQDIVKEMECFPLAIAQAQAYLQTMPVELHQYLDEYRRGFKEIMSRQPPGEDWKYNATAFTTWEISFGAIAKSNPQAAATLLTCSFLNNYDIWKEFIRRGLELPTEGLSVERLFEPLISYSLAKWRRLQTGFNIHAIVHTWARERLSILEKAVYSRQALYVLANAAPKSSNWHEAATWIFERRLMPHVGAFLNHSGFLDLPICPSKLFGYGLGGSRAPGVTQIPLLTSYDAVESFKTHMCLDDWAILGLRCISFTIKEQGDSVTAERVLRKVVEGWDYPYIKSQRSHWSRLLHTLGDLGGVLKDQHKYSDAEEQYRRILNESVDRQDELKHLILVTMDNLALVLQQQGKHRESESFYRKALHGWLGSNGSDDVDTATCQGNLGVLLMSLNRIDEAEVFIRQGLAVLQRRGMRDTPPILYFLHNLANIALRRGNISEAEKLARRVLEGRKRIYGEDNQHTLRAMVHLVATLVNANKCPEAEMWAHKAIEGFENLPGKIDIETLLARRSLARALKCEGKYPDSERIYREVLFGFQTSRPSKEVELGTIYELADVLVHEEEWLEALGYAKRALNGYVDLFPLDHEMVTLSKKMVAYILTKI